MLQNQEHLKSDTICVYGWGRNPVEDRQKSANLILSEDSFLAGSEGMPRNRIESKPILRTN